MKYILIGLLIIFVLIIIYKYNSIAFLTADESRRIFTKHNLCKFMHYSPDIFLNFTADEQTRLAKMVGEFKKESLLKKYIHRPYFAGFIKIEDARNWPFTVENYIVVSQSLITAFFKDYKFFTEIMRHEMIHLIQRRYQKQFNKLYYALGFIRVPDYRIITNSKVMYNPDDEPGAKWVYLIDDMNYFMPVMVEQNNTYSQKILELHVQDKDGFYKEENAKDIDKSPYSAILKRIWSRQFDGADLRPTNNNRYSPNEMIADLPEAEFLKILDKTSS